MRRTVPVAVVACFVTLLVSPSTAFTQEQPVGVGTYFECDQNREAQADTIVMEIFAPVFDRYISEGKLVSWGWAAHVLGGKWRRLLFSYTPDQSTLLTTRDELIAELQQSHPTEMTQFTAICSAHDDYVWRTVIARP